MIGLAIGGFIYALWELFGEAKAQDKKEYRDKPPRLFSMFWPLIIVASNSLSWAMTRDHEKTIEKKLNQAGLSYALTPLQFLGAQCVFAMLGAVVFWVLGTAMELGLALSLLAGGLLGFYYPRIWLSDNIKKRNVLILKALPFFLDILTLSVESGLNLAGGIQQAVDKCKPSPLIAEMNRVLRDVRAGRPRVEALRELAARLDFGPINSFVSALVQGELMGSSLGPILRAQSDQRRTERFLRAEKMAMEAPVKMLGPLIMFIFPCTFIVIGFPIVVKFMSAGI
jgi:tight adherence protein C